MLRDSRLACLADYSNASIQAGPVPVYRMDRLEPGQAGDAGTVLELLGAEAAALRPLGEARLHSIDAGLAALAACQALLPDRSRHAEVLRTRWPLGPMHGDCTPTNIMRSGGQPVLIDLDRFSMVGVPAIDRLHFELAGVCAEEGASWFDALVDADHRLQHRVSRLGELRLPYLLCRAGAEYRREVRMPERWIAGVRRAARRIES
ncbi:MAG: hypothetical protein ACI9WU_001943 [Myxococcota bacterium]